MALGDIVECLQQVAAMLDARGLSSGSLMHSVQQLLVGFQAEVRGQTASFEERMEISITHATGAVETVIR